MEADIRRWVKKKLDNDVDPDRLKAVLRNSDHDPKIVEEVLSNSENVKTSKKPGKESEKDSKELKSTETREKLSKKEDKPVNSTQNKESGKNSEEPVEKKKETGKNFFDTKKEKKSKRKPEKILEDNNEDKEVSVDLSETSNEEDEREEYSFDDGKDQEQKGRLPSIDYSFTDLGLKRVSIGLFFVLTILAAPPAYNYIQDTNLDARMQISMGEERRTANTDCTALGVQIGDVSTGNGVTVVDGFTRGNPEVILIARNDGKILDQKTFQAGDTFSRTLRATKGEIKIYPVGCEDIFDLEVIG